VKLQHDRIPRGYWQFKGANIGKTLGFGVVQVAYAFKSSRNWSYRISVRYSTECNSCSNYMELNLFALKLAFKYRIHCCAYYKELYAQSKTSTTCMKKPEGLKFAIVSDHTVLKGVQRKRLRKDSRRQFFTLSFITLIGPVRSASELMIRPIALAKLIALSLLCIKAVRKPIQSW